ncbi:GNAT family N-acetyltransferase [Paenibacillus taichungensis]|uniref:GNAT family N-acetyltransferase n=1 Tax=Paenibacillus taichungensis TaxID=484184 RepID=UPI002DBEC360|nr:GNAT family N-acetyltransferase [Paenibacillus taichungensis]MEC0108582.1 GNAT family N-acetyltransferase [Paenibacillus taichungensis]MEC0196082.1 GNAT family N-acetyltransferase [Paenibacillus taichungensis]
MKNAVMEKRTDSRDRTDPAKNERRDSRVRFYDWNSLEDMDWPNTEDGRDARAYLEPMMLQGTQDFMINVNTTLLIARIDDLVLPLTVNDAEYENSYVCSPYTHYVRYAKQELMLLRKPLLEKGLFALLSVVGWGMRQSQINKVVHINNWLLSTNLYPAMSGEQAVCLLAAVRERYPEHAVVFRSLCPGLHSDLTGELTEAGCQLIPSRQIYLYRANDPNFGNAKSRWLLKRDYELLTKHEYEFVSGANLTEEDIPRIAELYRLLYLEKYSYDNPQFSEHFIATSKASGALTLCGLRKEGRIDAVMGYFCRNGVMTTPLFGYDTALPQSIGLYRMLSVCLIGQARENGHLLHESAGAAQFKRNRGAVSDFEYSAVYERHLPMSRRWCWLLLERLLNRVGVPLMRRMKL